MRAVVMRNQTLVVATVPDPTPQAGEVVVRTLACGICGSDLHALRHAAQVVEAAREAGAPFVMDIARDVVLGHELAAEVVDYGPGCARTLPVGTRVCSMPLVLRSDGLHTVGYDNDLPGGYGELMVLSEMLLLPVPDALDTRHAALTEPMAVGRHAVEKAFLGSEDVPLVIGCGPVGLAVIAALALRGARPIVAADFSPRRRALATAMGADVVVDPAARSPYVAWSEVVAASGAPVDPFLAMLGMPARPAVVFECVGIPGLLHQIMRQAPRAARIVVVGVCMERDHIQPTIGINKELALQFVLAYQPHEFAETLGHLAAGRIDVTPLVTGVVGRQGVASAFDALASPEKHAKILVEPARS